MALFGLFGNKKRSLRDYGLDDLNRERITLEQEQRKIDQDITRITQDEQQLTSEYSLAGSPVQKKMIARKIQALRVRGKGVDVKSAHCHKMLQTINHFVVIKENMAFYERMGVASEIANMDLSEIESFVNDATIEGTLQQEKLAAMLQQVSDGANQIMEGAEDDSLEDLMAELDSAVTTPVKEGESDLGNVMKELDDVIAKGEQLAKEVQDSDGEQPQSTRQREVERE